MAWLEGSRVARPRFVVPSLVLAAASLCPAPAAAQTATAGGDDDATPQCAFQRKDHPDYVMWICNPEGSAYARDGLVLWMRTNDGGARVTSPVWSGPATELAKRGEAIISAHHASQARCAHYFHVAQARPRSAGWNVAPGSMRAWLDRHAAVRFPRFCYADDPGLADVVVVWGGPDDRLPHAFTIEIPWDISPGASPRRSRATTNRRAAAVPDPPELRLSAYEVRAGMDDTVIRLGVSRYAAEFAATPSARADWGVALAAALQALSASPHP